MPGSWIQLQLKAEEDRIMGAFREAPGRAAFYVQIRDSSFRRGKIGLVTYQSGGAFKDLVVWDKPRLIRSNWKDASVPAHLAESGPGDGLEGNLSPFIF